VACAGAGLRARAAAALAAVAKAIGATSKEQMAADIGVPMHPAAEAFWKQQGVL
jgi:TRAP-type uncharacterized transport system substrate-binding protein